MAKIIGFMVPVRSHPHRKKSLWSEANTLKDGISMPARTGPWQKTMEFVDGLKGKLLDEELARAEAKPRGGTGACYAG